MYMEIEFARKETKPSRALKKALHKLLQRHRFIDLTVNDLCREADVSRSSFYQNFMDKYNLMEDYIEDLFDYTLRVRDLNSDDEFISSLLTFLYENRKFIQNSFDLKDSELAQIHIKLIESTLTGLALKQGLVVDPESEDFKIRIRFLTGGLLSLVHSIVEGKDDLSKEAFINFALEANQALDSIQ